MKRGTFLILIIVIFSHFGLSQNQNSSEKIWPYPFPCRISDGKNPDVLVMTLGIIQTPLSQGTFDPVNDQVKLNDGTLITNYYKEKLGVKYYQPLDKSRFKMPPSGWCSWYYYYQEITEDEIKLNTRWIADNLKDYGASLVQLDDGWQGVGHGNGNNRDWTTIDKRFPGGMDNLASYIKSHGLIPGLWLAPHGQSNLEVVSNNPGAFLLKPDGTSASDTWEGKYLVDPSTKIGLDYLENLFAKLTNWGYEYLKIDGQPIVVREYKNKKEFMKNPHGDPVELYRNTLTAMRQGMGEENYLLGCWVIPIEGVGIMNGSRTSGDVLLSWTGFKTALRATMEHYYLHNVAWYSDPDVMLVRNPLTLQQAKVWATLQGLTGQALLSSDRMMDLSSDRVEIVKRVYPAVDIRPMDLFSYAKNKRIWDLKINHLGRNYDVVGLFNFERDQSSSIYLNWSDLGLDENIPVHVFDFWNNEYLGAHPRGIALELEQTSCRVISLHQATDQIQLVSTNRHITQGWVDLIENSFDKDSKTYNGKSNVIKEDAYQLRFAFPKNSNYKIVSARAKTSDGSTIQVRVMNHQGWAVAEILPTYTTVADWSVTFEEIPLYHIPTEEPTDLWLERVGIDGVNLRWTPRLQTSIGSYVYLNNELLGFTPTHSFPIRNLDPNLPYQVTVRTVCQDYSTSDKEADISFIVKNLWPNHIYLSEIEPITEGKGWRLPERNLTIMAKGIKLGGNYYRYGFGIPTNSEMEFQLKGHVSHLTGIVGIDEDNKSESLAEFIILGDGKEIWRSGWMKRSDNPMQMNVDLKGVDKLVLKTDRGQGAGTGDQANWADLKLEF